MSPLASSRIKPVVLTSCTLLPADCCFGALDVDVRAALPCSHIPQPRGCSCSCCSSWIHTRVANPRWDEWVDGARLLKFNETNIALQKALQSQSQAAQAAHASSSKAAKAASAKDSASASTRGGVGVRKDGARGTKRGREEVSRVYVSAAEGGPFVGIVACIRQDVNGDFV